MIDASGIQGKHESPINVSLPKKTPGPRAWEWIPVFLWIPLALASFVWKPAALAGPLLPCLTWGLLPGCLCRIFGRRSLVAHRIGLALALLAYLGIKQDWRRWDFARLWDGAPWVAAGMALVATQPVLGAWRWCRLLRAGGCLLRYRDCLRLVLTGTFFNLAIPGATGGDLARIVYLADGQRGDGDGGGGRWGRAVASVTLDRFLGTPAQLSLVAGAFALNADGLAALPFFAGLRPVALAAAAVSLLLPVLLVWGAGPLHRYATARAERARARGWPRLADCLCRLTGVLSVYGGAWGAIGGGLLIGFVSHALTVAATICFGMAAGVAEVPARAYFLLTPAGLAVNAIPLTPGGLGQGELAFADLFEYAAPGLGNDSAGVLVMLCLRLGLLAVGAVGGVLWLLGRHRLPATAIHNSQLTATDGFGL